MGSKSFQKLFKLGTDPYANSTNINAITTLVNATVAKIVADTGLSPDSPDIETNVNTVSTNVATNLGLDSADDIDTNYLSATTRESGTGTKLAKVHTILNSIINVAADTNKVSLDASANFTDAIANLALAATATPEVTSGVTKVIIATANISETVSNSLNDDVDVAVASKAVNIIEKIEDIVQIALILIVLTQHLLVMQYSISRKQYK